MTKRILIVTFLLIVLATSPAWLTMLFRRYSYGDAVARLRAMSIGCHGTEWCDGFSEADFSSVQIGMALDDVLDLVGEPFWGQRYIPVEFDEAKPWSGCSTLEFTTRKEGTSSFDRRKVTLSRDGKVTGIVREYVNAG